MSKPFLITEKIKKTNTYIENSVYNFPHRYNILRNNINSTCYSILELSYKANVYKDINNMKDIIIKIRMLEYYLKVANDNLLISFKKFENIGYYLLDINKMINAWIKSASKE